MNYEEIREVGSLAFSKWFPRLGKFRVVKKKTTGELRLFISLGNGFDRKYDSVTDSRAMDLFIWLGRYLALKKKLPSAISLNETAILSGRVERQIREVMANDVYNNHEPKR